MEPILTIKEIKLDNLEQQLEIETNLRRSLRTQGAAYDHIGFSWVSTGDTYTVYGYGWWDGES